MARILLLETATEVCSAAISVDGEVVAFAEKTEGFRHSEMLTLLIDRLLKEQGWPADRLEAVCTSRGPGSYTGLRIGVSVAKGVCYALNIPLLAVSSLNAMAIHMAGKTNPDEIADALPMWLCPMLDARRMEVYSALFDRNGNPLTEITAQIIGEQSFADELSAGTVHFFGNGASKCREVIRHPNARFFEDIKASARFMSTLAEERYNKNMVEDVSYFEPFYLKDFIATIPRNKVF